MDRLDRRLQVVDPLRPRRIRQFATAVAAPVQVNTNDPPSFLRQVARHASAHVAAPVHFLRKGRRKHDRANNRTLGRFCHATQPLSSRGRIKSKDF
jgi:hypothetical protein